MLAVQGANYICDGPQPLGAISNGCTQAAWASADMLHVTKSGCVIAWKHDAETPTPNKDTGEAASDPTWDPDQASVAASSDSAGAASDAGEGPKGSHPALSGPRVRALGLKLARCAS